MEFSLLGSALLAVGAMYGVLYWEGKRGNAAACTKDLWDITLGAGMVGLIFGRLATMIADGVNPAAHPGDIIIVRAGVATGWASLAALAMFAFLARGEIRAAADGVAAAALAGLAGWHAGCVFRDACLGTPSDLPWARALEGSAVTRHPTELYAALLFAVAALAMTLWKRKPPRLGVIGSVALAAAGAIRLVTEPIRPALGGRPTLWYLAAIVVGITTAAWLQFGARSTQPTLSASD